MTHFIRGADNSPQMCSCWSSLCKDAGGEDAKTVGRADAVKVDRGGTKAGKCGASLAITGLLAVTLVVAVVPFAFGDEAAVQPLAEGGQARTVVTGTGGTVDIMAVTIEALDDQIAFAGATEKRWDPDTLTWTMVRSEPGTWTDDHVSFKVINHSSVGIVAAAKLLSENGYVLTPDQESVVVKTAQGTQPAEAPYGVVGLTASGAPAQNQVYDVRVTIVINPLNCQHQTADTVVAPTHSAQGYTHHVCQICGLTWDDTYVAPLGHTVACYNVLSSTLSEHDQERIADAVKHLGDRGDGIYAYADGSGLDWSYYYYLKLGDSWYEAVAKSSYTAVLWANAGWARSSYPGYIALTQLQATDTKCDLIGNKRCAFSTVDESRLPCGQ